MVIEGVQEELELEAGPFPTKRSNPDVSTIFKASWVGIMRRLGQSVSGVIHPT